MSPTCLFRIVFCLVLFFPVLGRAQAQDGRAAGPERQPLRLEGVLQGLQPGLLQVVSEGGEPWLVKVEARPENITYLASAQPGWLQPGMYVQFKAKFDKKGKALAPISQLTVFTPRDDTPLGAFPESAIGAPTGELFGEAKPAPKTKPESEPLSLTIAGRLTGTDDAKFRVLAGAIIVEAELAEQATISVELNNYALARVGDRVSINGWHHQKGQGWAERLLVRAAQPLASGKKERIVVSPEDRKKALDALDDLSAGETASKAAKDSPPLNAPAKTASPK